MPAYPSFPPTSRPTPTVQFENTSIKDAGPSQTLSVGVSGARFTSSDQSASPASITDAPTSGQKIVLTELVISSAAAIRLDFKEETSGTVVLSVYMAVNSTVVIPLKKLKLATANKKLQVQASGAGNIAITPVYYSEA